MTFGQIVVGPPGSGKSTYCNGMQQYLTALGRKVAVVNLDPANDSVPYDCAVNIMDLICLEEVMKETKLGPNGGELSQTLLLLLTLALLVAGQNGRWWWQFQLNRRRSSGGGGGGGGSGGGK
jgi:GTPase SAR1 family protein